MKTRLYLSLKQSEVLKLLEELGEVDDGTATGIDSEHPTLGKLRKALREARQ